jgi:hypothetical protein
MKAAGNKIAVPSSPSTANLTETTTRDHPSPVLIPGQGFLLT